MKSISRILFTAIIVVAIASISSSVKAQEFTLGADISWYTQMEASGFKFCDSVGNETTCPELMKSIGLSAIRLRVWVNPSDGYCGKDDVVKKAVAAKNAGLDVMIDFHLSDTWADPSNQTTPSAWASHNATQLCADIKEHVTDVLTGLVDAGVTPKWVQIGNEENDGILWSLGKASKYPTNYANFVAAGYDAVKAINKDIKVIVHVSNGFDQGLFDWNIGLLNLNKFDIIGMSLYPSYQSDVNSTIDKYIANVKHLYTKFGKECMLVEVGLPVGYVENSYETMQRILSLSKESTDNHCLGVFYWEPESYGGWNKYQLGAASRDGMKIQLTQVMNAFTEIAGEAGAGETGGGETGGGETGGGETGGGETGGGETGNVDEDVNQDGNVDSQDVLKIYDFMKTSTGTTSDPKEDVNGDGNVDSQDVLRVYDYIKRH